MKSLRNYYNTSPLDIKVGDTFAIITVFHIMDISDNEMQIAVYQSPYPPEQTFDEIPQGGRIYGARKLLEKLWVTLTHAFEIFDW